MVSLSLRVTAPFPSFHALFQFINLYQSHCHSFPSLSSEQQMDPERLNPSFQAAVFNCVSPFSSLQTQSREHSLQHGLRRPRNADRAFSQSLFSLRTSLQPDNV